MYGLHTETDIANYGYTVGDGLQGSCLPGVTTYLLDHSIFPRSRQN